MNGAVLLYALIFMMIAFWSGNYIIGKIALREIPALLVAGLRIGMAGLFMLPFYAWERGRETARWTRADVPTLLWLGVFGVTLNQLFFVVGLSRTSVAHSAIIIGLTPVLVLLLACLRGLERMTMQKMLGLAVALAGVAVLKAFEPATGTEATWIGDFLTFLTALCFAIFTVFGKEVTKRHTTVTVNTFAYVGGALALAPITVWQAVHHPLTHVSAAAWLSVVYMALFPSVLAYLIYYYALTHITASRVSAFSYLQPVFATAMGVAILGEHLSASVIVGGAIIFAGVYLVEHG
ncbi:MAG: DMT family transporter [Bryobacteraceae bacterium]